MQNKEKRQAEVESSELQFKREHVVEAFQNAYGSLLNRCKQALDEGKLPVIYGTQAIGKSGVIIPSLESVNVSPTAFLEVGDVKKDQLALERPVIFVTVRTLDGVKNQIDSDVRELQNNYPQLGEKAIVTIEAKFRPNVSNVKQLLKLQFGDDLQVLDDEWFEAELRKMIFNLPKSRPLEFLLNGCLDLYEKTSGFKKNKLKEFTYSLKKKLNNMLFGKDY